MYPDSPVKTTLTEDACVDHLVFSSLSAGSLCLAAQVNRAMGIQCADPRLWSRLYHTRWPNVRIGIGDDEPASRKHYKQRQKVFSSGLKSQSLGIRNLLVNGPEYSFFLQILQDGVPVFEGQTRLCASAHEGQILIQNALPAASQRLDAQPPNYRGEATSAQREFVYHMLTESDELRAKCNIPDDDSRFHYLGGTIPSSYPIWDLWDAANEMRELQLSFQCVLPNVRATLAVVRHTDGAQALIWSDLHKFDDNYNPQQDVEWCFAEIGDEWECDDWARCDFLHQAKVHEVPLTVQVHNSTDFGDDWGTQYLKLIADLKLNPANPLAGFPAAKIDPSVWACDESEDSAGDHVCSFDTPNQLLQALQAVDLNWQPL